MAFVLQTATNGTVRRIPLDGHNVDLDDIFDLAVEKGLAVVDESTRRRIGENRKLLEEIVDREPVYGVTTGYGEMVYITVDKSKETELQTNVVRSHAFCVGDRLSREESRAILAARINALCRGYSGVREELVEAMVAFLNRGIVPLIPEAGSVGASGDLGPLSHVALALIGEGYVLDDNDERVPTAEMLARRNLRPLELKYKEGLALINGTSAMTGMAALILRRADDQIKQAEIVAALVLENQMASDGAFRPEGHVLGRPHPGQIDSAGNALKLLEGSKLIRTHRELKTELGQVRNRSAGQSEVYLQKAYTLRCIPQVTGAVKEAVEYARKVVTREINSSNDNPLFFPGKEVFHGGNFHGQPVAMAMDFACLALTQLGVVSERRTNRLLNRHLNNGLPQFLVKSDPGLNCGLSGLQYAACDLVAENRTLCTPASVQSISCNGDNQDVVSMGLTAARKCKRVLKNNYYILAIELLAAVQAVDLAGQYNRLSPVGKITYQTVRSRVPTVDKDRCMSDDVYRIAGLLQEAELLQRVTEAGVDIK
ncbi:uncharacterized protein LOC111629276 [Centruroides sculpturatus]|uniref:uncharacterized protein LOC111629276 n=1 Tax=Centruroides sculpturatus TaxID=218467 RepID=UPI000C6E4B9B|nr:uncharacterized protein LOC111629276 [Centruroides sculpturatus]